MSSQSAAALSIDDDLIAVPDDPNGLAFDPGSGALYVADGYSGAITRVLGGVEARIATIEAGDPVTADRIGGLAVTPQGTLYVARTGQGHSGAIFRVGPDGTPERLDRLPTRFWRHGLAYDAGEHALYATQFMSGKYGPFDGSIIVIDLVTGEPSTILDGFQKPTGIAKLGSTLVVADARQRAVFRIQLVAGRAVFRLQLAADIGRPDSLCACGPDAVLVTTYDEDARLGAVRRLWLDGRRSEVIARGPWEPRGIATDGERVYVAAHRTAAVLAFSL